MKFEIYETQIRIGMPSKWEYRWRWRLRARGKIVANSYHDYPSKDKVRRAIIRLWTSLQLVQPLIVEVEA